MTNCVQPRLCRRSWLACLCVVAMAALAIALGSAGYEGAHAQREVVEPSGVFRGAEAEGHLPAGFSAEHMVFLPAVLRGFPSVANDAFGVQLYWSDSGTTDLASSGGARWVRIPFEWRSVEPDANLPPSEYQWPAYLDVQLAELSAHGVQVLLTFTGNPPWAADYPGGPVNKVDVSVLAEFMNAAVLHYGAPPYNIRYWEFYNEPDNGRLDYALKGWGYFGHTPQAYVDLLAAVYPAMKVADPQVQVAFGGLALDNWEPAGPFVKSFLTDTLAVGGSAFFDVMNFHYYPLFHGNWDPYGRDIIGKTNYVRDVLANHGVAKPLICTEVGTASDDRCDHGGSTELQARYVPQAFVRSIASGLKITTWFTLLDSGEGGCTTDSGLVQADRSPKDSYWAYQTLAGQLTFSPYVRAWGPDRTGSDQVEAYEFSEPSGSRPIIVAWSDDGLNHSLFLSGDEVLLVDKLGNQSVIYDEDGDTWVVVTVGPSPVYLHPYSGALR